MAKILVVEDEVGLRESISDYLSAQRHIVEGTGNGDDALAMLKTYSYDLVILDWNIDGLPGPEVCRQFRSSGGSVPTLMLTARDMIDAKIEGFAAGCDDYLTKPFDLRELSSRVQALLRRPNVIQAEILTAGKIALDPQKKLCTLEGEPVQLAPQEFALLEFLVKHPNIPYSSEALLGRVWRSDADVSEHTVRTCIYRIKTRLNLSEGNPRIKNVHGVGYVFELQTQQ